MKLFKKIAIVGTGLIGGSIGLEIKNKKLADEVLGVSRHEQSLNIAKKIKAIDRGSLDFTILKEADLVILAMPVGRILQLAPKIAKYIKPKAVVCDVGSTKEEIVRKLEKVFSDFVGTHPLAGSEKRGVANCSKDLFLKSLCIITSTEKTKKSSLEKIEKFWSQLGAKVILLSPSEHDRIIVFVSHLPHLAAFSLINAVPKEFLKFAASGLKSTTRIAASDPQLWADIFLSNQKNVAKAIDLLQKNLGVLKKLVLKNNKKHLEKILRQAKFKRDILK